MAIFARRSTRVGLFAAAVAGLAAASTGMALAADTVPSVQVKMCTEDGEPWEMTVTGENQNGDTVTETFSGDSCDVLSKGGTEYWWAVGTSLTTSIDGIVAKLGLPDDPKRDGTTHTVTLHQGTPDTLAVEDPQRVCGSCTPPR